MYIYGTKVKVKSGFFKDKIGDVVEKLNDKKYEIEILTPIYGNPRRIKCDETNLEKIN